MDCARGQQGYGQKSTSGVQRGCWDIVSNNSSVHIVTNSILRQFRDRIHLYLLDDADFHAVAVKICGRRSLHGICKQSLMRLKVVGASIAIRMVVSEYCMVQ